MKNKKTFDTALIVVIIVGIILYGFVLDSNTITMELGDNAVGVAGPDKTTAILLFEEIESVELYEDFDPGEAVEQTESEEILNGIFENELLGEYQILAYQDCSSMIVITTSDTVFAFNNSTAEETGEDYLSILEAMGE